MIVFTEPARLPSRRIQHIAEMAQRRLSQTPYRTIQRLSCQFDGHILTLRGELPSFYQNQLAQEAVAGMEGVERVVNLVEVRPDPHAAPHNRRVAAED
jgi:osmotically-inducible protein OsmY